MRIMSKVCAEFHTKSGEFLFKITPDKLLALIDAPDEIQQDPLYGLLIGDHLLEVIVTKADQKRLENDPDKPAKAEKPAKSARIPKAEKPVQPSNPAETDNLTPTTEVPAGEKA